MQACDRCHRRKSKCDKIRPCCGSCLKGGVSCVYSDKAKGRMYQQEFVDRLERKNRLLESTNRALSERLVSIGGSSQQPTSDVPSSGQNALPNRDTTQTENDIANEVSFFSTSAGGDRQFLGSASGVLLANIVRGSLSTSARRESVGTASTLDNTPGFEGSVVSTSQWSIDDSVLPPLALARQLIEAYLAHDHLCYPCLHPQSVREMLDSIYRDKSYYRRYASEAFMFDMLLAIGTLQVHKFHWQALPDAETHLMRAMLRLNAMLSNGGLKALQGMLLLCQFRLSSSTKDTTGSLWHLVGVAARMSLEMGLHKESIYRLKSNDERDQVEGFSYPERDEQEVRRRCFWCVFALDRVVSITLGRPLALCLEDIDVELPQVDIYEDVSPSIASTGDEQASPQTNLSSRTAVFVHIVRYRTLCGKFLTTIHRHRRNGTQPERQLREMRDVFALELESWRANTISLDLPDMDLSSPITEARSSFRSKAWYELLYHNAVLLLYRPTPILSPSDTSNDKNYFPRIFSAAKQSITLYAYLFRSRKINFSWMVLHAVFMAGLTYIYAVSRHIREMRKARSLSIPVPQILPENPSIVEIVNDCRACSQVLIAVSERCNAQKSCHEVFDRLSDAVLADAVDLVSVTCPRQVQGIDHEQPLTPDRSRDRGPMMYMSPITDNDNGDRNFQAGGKEPAISHPHVNHSPGLPNHHESHYDPDCMAGAPALMTDSTLRDCFPDIQQMYDVQWGDDPILQLSMDWLGDVDPGGGFA